MRSAHELRYEAIDTYTHGELVYFWNGYAWCPYTFIRYHEYSDATRIRNGNGDRIVHRWELISESRYLAEKQADAKEEAKKRYAEIINHWNRGLRKSKEIGSLIGETPRAAARMIVTAKKFGLLTEDENAKPPVDQPK